nr:hypothetical protein Iba_chr08dCG5120 [Ipomoea batatas]
MFYQQSKTFERLRDRASLSHKTGSKTDTSKHRNRLPVLNTTTSPTFKPISAANFPQPSAEDRPPLIFTRQLRSPSHIANLGPALQVLGKESCGLGRQKDSSVSARNGNGGEAQTLYASPSFRPLAIRNAFQPRREKRVALVPITTGPISPYRP